ncbi:hypothetical protein KY342_01465 [Candidatus Woesearchaeota archaeon]|nr:hypothetical protein [Candidatus Woesearchaeota archaeon]
MITSDKFLPYNPEEGYIWLRTTLHPVFDRGRITNCTDLQNMKNDLSANYVLANNINCSDTVNWNSGQGFDPIGNNTNRFNGSFNGQRFIITGLYINRSTSYVGLFGDVDNGTVIKNVGLEDVNIEGYEYVGSLVGYNRGNINNSFATGNTTGSNYTGGLIGYNDQGNISNSYIIGNINGSSGVGGIVGYNNQGNISNSYATGNVTGSNYIGGLVGTANFGEVVNSFATGNITGSFDVGGLIGNNSGTLTNSYWNNHTGNPDNCTGNQGNPSGCNAVQDNESYFYNSTNPPMTSWDFVNVWQENINDYPSFNISVYEIPINRMNSDGSGPGYCFDDGETEDYYLVPCIDCASLRNLIIWDETDSGMPYGNQTKYANEQVKFFANYTNSTGTIEGANCTINFSDGSGYMSWNTTGFYEYNRSFSSDGTYDWNVTCTYSLIFNTANDNVTIDVIPSVPAAPSVGAPSGAGRLTVCAQEWNCSDWEPCLPNGIQHRECWDLNRCEDLYSERVNIYIERSVKPIYVRNCIYEPRCDDGILNNDESDVDCGGPCTRCEDGKICRNDDDCINKCDLEIRRCYTPIGGPEVVEPVVEVPSRLGTILILISSIIILFILMFMTYKYELIHRGIEYYREKRGITRKAKIIWKKTYLGRYREQLNGFFSDALNRGYTEKQIKDMLVRKGWSGKLVDEYYKDFLKKRGKID